MRFTEIVSSLANCRDDVFHGASQLAGGPSLRSFSGQAHPGTVKLFRLDASRRSSAGQEVVQLFKILCTLRSATVTLECGWIAAEITVHRELCAFVGQPTGFLLLLRSFFPALTPLFNPKPPAFDADPFSVNLFLEGFLAALVLTIHIIL